MLVHSIALAALVAGMCPADVSAPLRGCARGAPPDCAELQRQLVRCFGASNDDERLFGQTLARRLVEVVARPPVTLATALSACVTSDCVRLAQIVARLFNGADEVLDRSADRSLARALAERLVADDRETSCASR
jgi:hypothetical protein